MKLVKNMFGLKLCQLLYFIIIYISSFTNPLAERLVIKIINSSTCIMPEFVLREKTVNLHFHLNVNKLGTTTNNNLHNWLFIISNFTEEQCLLTRFSTLRLFIKYLFVTDLYTWRRGQLFLKLKKIFVAYN